MESIKELSEALKNLEMLSWSLEQTYIDNGGEITDETEQMEQEIANLKQLLKSPEGVDLLGRWLKGKQDKKVTLKAEKDFIQRQIDANDKSIERIKAFTTKILQASDEQKVVGNLGYSFTATNAVSTEVNKDRLKELFLSAVEAKLRGESIIPDDVTVSLGASVSKVPEGADLPDYYNRTETPSVTFRKPKAKEE